MSLFGMFDDEHKEPAPRKPEIKNNIVSRYQLCSKNVPLIDFTYTVNHAIINGIPDKEYTLTVQKVHYENLQLKPLSLAEITDQNLFSWLKKRKAPAGRTFVDKLLYSINEDGNPLKYIEVTHALSVNDVFWVNNLDYPVKWSEINLYTHKVDSVLANIAFVGISKNLNGKHYSPELTTNGNQRKCWINLDGKIVLRKGVTDIFDRGNRSDVYSEYYAAQVAEALGINHVKYELDEFKHEDGRNELTSLCPAFTDENIGYIPVFYLLKDEILSDISGYKKQLEIGSVYGKEAFEDMMLFDSIILNVDRHLGNFGMLYDTDTGEIIGPAPLFDHGNSLMAGAAGMDFDNFERYLQEVNNPYGITFDEMMLRFVQQRHLERIRNLLEFEFVPHPRFGGNEDYLNYMSKIIQDRARKALSLYREKEKLIYEEKNAAPTVEAPENEPQR